MLLKDLHIDRTRQYMVDVHGKQYPIKKQRGRFYIQHAKGQLTVTEAIKPKIIADWCFDYVFGGLSITHPCPAINYFIYRHRMGHKITTTQYITKFNIKLKKK